MHNTPVVYEVNISMEKQVKNEYLAWAKSHVAEILKIPGFVTARIYEVSGDADGRSLLSIQYGVKSREDLAHYFNHDAPRLRAEGEKRFGDRVSVTRRVLTLIE